MISFRNSENLRLGILGRWLHSLEVDFILKGWVSDCLTGSLHQLEIGLFLTLLFLFIFNFLFIMEKEKTYLLCVPIYFPHPQIILKQIPNISFHP